jgi:hypothetical protein
VREQLTPIRVRLTQEVLITPVASHGHDGTDARYAENSSSFRDEFHSPAGRYS